MLNENKIPTERRIREIFAELWDQKMAEARDALEALKAEQESQ